MAETAGDIIRDALTELTVQAQEQTVPAVDLNTGVRYLNRMLAAWSAEGMEFGYTEVSAPNDVLTIPAGITEAVVFNLALRLANQYDIAVNPSLAQAAADGMRTVHLVGVKTGKATFPSTLPIGSGNEGFGGNYDGDPFYPDCCEDYNSCSSSSDGDSNGV